jgi:hypothetical protein
MMRATGRWSVEMGAVGRMREVMPARAERSPLT